jgi:hypothetical protein
MSDNGLIQEAKAFQAIRVLNIFYEDNERKRDAFLNDLEDELFDRISSFEEFRFYIDAFFTITDAYYLNAITFQRRQLDHEKKQTWTCIDFSEKAISHPAYLLFTSAFNEGIDKSFRNAIQVNNEDLNCRLEPISYYLFNQITFNKKYDLSEDEIKDKKLAVLFFQIRDAQLAKHLTDNDKLFSENLFQIPKKPNRDYDIVAYGILKGDIEGFILFDITNRTKEQLMDFLNANGTFAKYSPLSLYFCSWNEKFFKKENFLQLKRICTE